MFRTALRLHKVVASPVRAQIAKPLRSQIASLYTIPTLPYKVDHGVPGLLSPEALKTIQTEHQTDLLNTLNKLIAGTHYEELAYVDLILETARSTNQSQIFNHASQAWNTDFFLQSLTATPRPMKENLAARISESFGSVDSFEREFTASALGMFGSGFTWLVENGQGQLVLLNTYNAGTPHHRRRQQRFEETSTDQDFASSAQNPHAGASQFSAPAKLMANKEYTPILCISMWEHAYMTDYGTTREAKENYLASFFRAVDWDFVGHRVFRATGF